MSWRTFAWLSSKAPTAVCNVIVVMVNAFVVSEHFVHVSVSENIFPLFCWKSQTVLASIRHVMNIHIFITVYLYIPIFCFCTFVYFMLGCTDFIAFFSTCHYLLSLRVLREILNWLMAHRLCGNLSTCVLKAFSHFAAKNIMFPTEFDYFFCCYCDFSFFVLCKYWT